MGDDSGTSTVEVPKVRQKPSHLPIRKWHNLQSWTPLITGAAPSPTSLSPGRGLDPGPSGPGLSVDP